MSPEQTALRLKLEVENGLSRYIDAMAMTKGYASQLACAVRAGYPGKYQAEGLAFAFWMDNCYDHNQAVQADVIAGDRRQPTVAELINELPVLIW